jgi:hypothetical protein
MLYLLSFDVLYINPEKDPYYWNEIDQDNLSSLVKGNLSLPCESFESRCKKGKRINQVDSVTFQMQEELHSTFYTNGVYQPWQFRKGTTESVFINGTVMDLTVSWNEPAKARQGFSVHDMTVSVPYFFQKIEGEYLDKKEYKKLVETCTSAPNTVFVKGNGTALLPKNISRDDMLSLTFCLDNNGKLDYEKVKERPFYSLNCYKEEIQKLIIHKINETLDDEGLFNFTFNKEEKLQYMMMVMNMDAVFIRAIDNFDFTSYIPKIVIFLEKETVLDNTFACFLGFFTKIGFDIVIFDPSGLYNPHVILNEDHLNIIRLDEMNYESTYESLSQIKEKKEGFFKRFFL